MEPGTVVTNEGVDELVRVWEYPQAGTCVVTEDPMIDQVYVVSNMV